MAVRHRVGNALYYGAIDGPLAYTWATAWLVGHNNEVRNHSENDCDLNAINPLTHPEGCLYRLDFVMHFEHETTAEFLASFQEIVDALQNGGVVTVCDAEFGYDVE